MDNNIDYISKQNFLYPVSSCHSQSCSQDQKIHDDLQQFAHQVNYIVALHENGKLSTQQACQKLTNYWHLLDLPNFSE